MHRENKNTSIYLPSTHVDTIKEIASPSRLFPFQADGDIALTINLGNKELRGLRYEKNGNNLTIFFEGLSSPIRKDDLILKAEGSLEEIVSNNKHDLFITLCEGGWELLQEASGGATLQKPVLLLGHSSIAHAPQKGLLLDNPRAKNCTQVVSDVFSWRIVGSQENKKNLLPPEAHRTQLLGRLLSRTIFDEKNSTTLGVLTHNDIEKTQAVFDDVVSILSSYKTLHPASEFVCILAQEPGKNGALIGVLSLPEKLQQKALQAFQAKLHRGLVVFGAGDIRRQEDIRGIASKTLRLISQLR